MKRILLIGMVAAAMALAPKTADAALLQGGISLSSQPIGPGLNNVLPVDSAGNQVGLAAATALDFTTTGAKTPGTPGNFRVDNTSGDFNVLFGLGGLIRDFSFIPPGNGTFPFVPVVSFQTITNGPPVTVTFTFDITSIIITEQNSNRLSLTGLGTFHMTGFQDTQGMWNFQTNNAASVFAFAGSEATVPEPTTMMLLGTGLLGLAAATRRMRKA